MGLTSLNITEPFLEMEFQPHDEDRTGAWELYFELITRAPMHGLNPNEADEATKLRSIYELFSLTRETIKLKA